MANKIACSNCDMCGAEMGELSCTLILEEETKIDKACWCICKDCAKKFKEEVVNFYKPLVKELKEQKKAQKK